MRNPNKKINKQHKLRLAARARNVTPYKDGLGEQRRLRYLNSKQWFLDLNSPGELRDVG